MDPQNNPKRIRAKRKLRHYFGMIAEKAGVRLDSDCYYEIDEIVEDIIDAAVDQMKADEQREKELVLLGKAISGGSKG